MVIATQNPADHHGTYPLPESQLDRFLMRCSIGYPDAQSEREIIRQPKCSARRNHSLRAQPANSSRPACESVQEMGQSG